MQRWEEELSKHPINSILKLFEEQATRDVVIDDSSLVAEKSRFLKVVLLMKRAISDLDPELAPLDILGQLQNQLNSHGVVNSLNEFARTSNPEMFRQANNQISASLSYIYQLSSLKFSRSTRRADIDAATKSFEQFVHQTNRLYEEYKTKVAAAEEAVQVASNEIGGIKSRAEKLEETFNTKMGEWSTQITDAHNSQSTAFADAQNSRQNDYNAALDRIKNEARLQLDTFYKEQDVAASGRQEALQSQLDWFLADSGKKHERILQLYGLVAYDSVTGGYQSTADTEGASADRWRKITVGCIVLTAVWLLLAIWYFKPDLEPERLFWSEMAKSVSLTALLISAAVYASKQSTLHRRNERRARSFFLQVQAFDPFISDLPDDKKATLKEGMSTKIFGADDPSHEGTLITTSQYEGMDRLIDMFGKLQGLISK